MHAQLLHLTPTLNGSVRLEERDGECYLYSPESAALAMLDNYVARRIVGEVDGRTRADDICERLAREFTDVALPQIQQDVVEMLRVLEQQEFIEFRQADASG